MQCPLESSYNGHGHAEPLDHETGVLAVNDVHFTNSTPDAFSNSVSVLRCALPLSKKSHAKSAIHPPNYCAVPLIIDPVELRRLKVY
jgi:hypothetical protein